MRCKSNYKSLEIAVDPRTIPCPECGAGSGFRCQRLNGKMMLSCHQVRIQNASGTVKINDIRMMFRKIAPLDGFQTPISLAA